MDNDIGHRLRLLQSISDDERILLRHIVDLGQNSQLSGRSRYSCFLDERQLALCTISLEQHLSEGGDIPEYELLGGYDKAERRVIVFSGYGYTVPFSPVVFRGRDVGKLSHRDFLGTLMSLDIKREMIGDILVGEKQTVVFVMNSVLPVVEEITKVGGVGVTIDHDFHESYVPEKKFEIINATVKSLRIDAVLSDAISVSREKAQAFIRSEGVLLNHLMTFDPSERVNEGDVFSLRGRGKFMLNRVGGMSKKDRIFITIHKYK
ncbi:MAG: YlmH/Sll1252 family protein [Oscillospiraceae bacterium]|nr:YlmH/Sll1252 family protein [Oscillospiraceae bacterium]